MRSHRPGPFVSATICYKDVFDRPHFTKLCRVLGPHNLEAFGTCANDTVDATEQDAERACPEPKK